MGITGARVLLVGENPAERRLASAYLNLVGVEVVAVSSVRDALSCIREVAMDAVLTSCRMRDGGGTALLAELQRHGQLSHVPVVAVTGLPISGHDAAKIGFAGFVRKPYDLLSLIGELQRVLLFR